MFLEHSRRELDLNRIYGVTTEAGISLVSPNYPYHYLVEQEERWHGAILGNTAHGILYCTFGSMSCDPPGGILVMPGVVAQDPKIPPLRAYHYCRRYRREMFDDSRDANESFAKYLALLAQTSLIGEFTSELVVIFDTECQKYPFLLALSEFLGLPFANTDYDYNFKKYTAYTLSKLAFNTGELKKLYRLEALDAFRDEVVGAGFWDATSPNSRTAAIVGMFSASLFEDIRSEYDKNID